MTTWVFENGYLKVCSHWYEAWQFDDCRAALRRMADGRLTTGRDDLYRDHRPDTDRSPPYLVLRREWLTHEEALYEGAPFLVLGRVLEDRSALEDFCSKNLSSWDQDVELPSSVLEPDAASELPDLVRTLRVLVKAAGA